MYTDDLYRKLFATDASVYREIPLGVAYPANKTDVQKIVRFAHKEGIPIIPRAAGTSLAGQVVGNGLVVDCSKYFTGILELNVAEKWVRLQPGVVLDELNYYLQDFGLFFGPETSTSTHCTIGGMFGNNSCGTHSILYGSMREHVIETEVVLSNGELFRFQPEMNEEFKLKMTGEGLQANIYKRIHQLFKKPDIQELIKRKFPPVNVIRRNTGYAIDELIATDVFQQNKQPFNFCKLLAGSEGTLAFTTEIKLNLVDLPPPEKAVVCLQHNSIADACKANLIALDCQPTAVELMDDVIIKMARQNPVQREKSSFIQGLPKAVLLVEFMAHSKEKLSRKVKGFLHKATESSLSYYHTVLYNKEVAIVWNLRKAGLGVLGNMVGDKKPVALVEDTAVAPEVLPEYIAEFEQLMTKYNKECVFYAHISAGELHLRPVLNLKDEQDRELFYNIGKESAELVAKYNGSISGEHGDGRLRGEFIPIQYGKDILQLFQKVKSAFDPQGIFNPGKIVHTPPMNEFLRYESDQQTKEFNTVYDFSSDLGLLRATEKCNGVGFCRKSEVIGGTMCPSYQATRNEKDSTRARANTLREVLTNSTSKNPFKSKEIEKALDLCLSCKACKSECPSSVDMAKLKSEVLQQKYNTEGVPFATKMMVESPALVQRFHFIAPLLNFLLSASLTKKIMGIAKERAVPKIADESLEQWFNKQNKIDGTTHQRPVYIFNDEFINFYDVGIGKKAIQLFQQLGYSVNLFTGISGRTHISKGVLTKAKQIAKTNIENIRNILPENAVLIGLEPSTILTFRDEYIDLLRGEEKQQAKEIAERCFTFEEFFNHELKQGIIQQNQFSSANKQFYVHGHCQQKALIGNINLLESLQAIPSVEIIESPSGCCGMAGSFGYEYNHYKVSMEIGELVLFPAIRDADKDSLIIAPGTSCRHQIADGTNQRALHPAEVLYQFVKK